MRRLFLLCVLLGMLAIGWLAWPRLAPELGLAPGPSRQSPGITPPGINIDQQPATFSSRGFDPAAPPADMPPLGSGETAECDSNFLSSAVVGGEARPTDATHALVTITKIKVTLQLNITVWAPAGASQRVLEHEQGHRQISEYYYQTAGKIAAGIAARQIGATVLISGPDLQAELSKLLQQTGADIGKEYNRELNPEPAQLRYDSITDHSRNDVAIRDAVAQAIQDSNLATMR